MMIHNPKFVVNLKRVIQQQTDTSEANQIANNHPTKHRDHPARQGIVKKEHFANTS